MPNRPRECDSPESAVDVRYANHFQIGHNDFEFVLDFGQLFSDGRAERLHTRIVTTPRQAREFLTLLNRSVAQYEESFGPINMDDRD